MIKRKNALFLLAIIFILAAFLTGCSKFDCSGYIQAMLDSIYKGNHEAYADITHVSESDLALNYEEGINAEIEALISYMNIAEYSSFVNEDTRENARNMFKNIYQHADYTVGEADESGFVTVTIRPIDIYQLADADLTEYNSTFYARNENGEFAAMDDETFYSSYIQGAIDILSSYLDQIGYTAPRDVTVHVIADENHVYSITEDEILQLDRYIIDYE